MTFHVPNFTYFFQETTFMYVPNSAVGALIGTRGSFIRNIIRFSGASVKIAPLAQDQQVDAGYERQVTIVGNPEAQWKVRSSPPPFLSLIQVTFL
jgi:insulin-like growth factor 2 mRNA-binding protein 1